MEGRFAGCQREVALLSRQALMMLDGLLGTGSVPSDHPGPPAFMLCALCCPWALGLHMGPSGDQADQVGSTALALIQNSAVRQPDLARAVASSACRQVRALADRAGSGGGLAGLDLSSPAGQRLLYGLRLLLQAKMPGGEEVVPEDVKLSLPGWLLQLASGLPSYAPPRQRAAAGEALGLAIELGAQADEVLQALRDPVRGEALYINTSAKLHTWILFGDAGRDIVPALARAMADPESSRLTQHTAEMVLTGLAEALRRSSAGSSFGDPRVGSFLQAVLPALPQLATLAAAPGSTPGPLGGPGQGSSAGDRRGALIRLLEALLALPSGPRLLLNQKKEGGRALLRAYLQLLGTGAFPIACPSSSPLPPGARHEPAKCAACQQQGAADASIRADALQLLASFLAALDVAVAGQTADRGPDQVPFGSTGQSALESADQTAQCRSDQACMHGGGGGGGIDDAREQGLAQLKKTLEGLADLFPERSTEYAKGSSKAALYGRQLMVLLDAAVAAAAQELDVTWMLKCLLPVVQEMGSSMGHVRQEALSLRFARLAAAVWGPEAGSGTMEGSNVAAAGSLGPGPTLAVGPGSGQGKGSCACQGPAAGLGTERHAAVSSRGSFSAAAVGLQQGRAASAERTCCIRGSGRSQDNRTPAQRGSALPRPFA